MQTHKYADLPSQGTYICTNLHTWKHIDTYEHANTHVEHVHTHISIHTHAYSHAYIHIRKHASCKSLFGIHACPSTQWLIHIWSSYDRAWFSSNHTCHWISTNNNTTGEHVYVCDAESLLAFFFLEGTAISFFHVHDKDDGAYLLCTLLGLCQRGKHEKNTHSEAKETLHRTRPHPLSSLLFFSTGNSRSVILWSSEGKCRIGIPTNAQDLRGSAKFVTWDFIWPPSKFTEEKENYTGSSLHRSRISSNYSQIHRRIGPTHASGIHRDI